MIIMNDNAIYSVYMHISPEGKRYIGQCKDINRRWRKGGIGYKKDNAYFWADIQKYGWDNFEHVVVKSQLTKTDALNLESDLIHQYQTINPDKGYNHRTGGRYKGEISAAYREQLRQHQLSVKSAANACWVSNNKEARLIPRTALEDYLNKGYHIGRAGENAVYINKDGITKRIKGIDVDKYIADGWLLGKSEKTTETINKSRQQFIWMCDNKEFSSAQALATYLRTKYYPKIASSTITAMFNGKSCHAYPDLLNIVSRRPIEH